jgi:hypothetical protein
MIKTLLITTAVLLTIVIGLALLFLRRVPIVPEKDCLVAKGIVAKIEEGSSFDVIFTLHTNQKFYINRGLENGLNIDSLRKYILLQEVTIKYPDYTAPFGAAAIHLSKLEHGEKILYSELND